MPSVKVERVRALLWGQVEGPGGPTLNGLESTAPEKQKKYI